jgi:flavin-dependent dehydrogenase
MKRTRGARSLPLDMRDIEFDAIVVGARCAGAPTAMLLARKGYKVLVVDKATFPSDTISTHLVHPPGVAALKRWGLLDRLLATGCPGIDTYVFDFGTVTVSGAPGTDEAPLAYAPRRTVLDKLLVDAAAEAGAGLREGFTVDDLVIEDGRVVGIQGHGNGEPARRLRARVVVGADGHHSLVARLAGAEQYNQIPPLQVSYYTYVSGLPLDGRYEVHLRPGRGFGAWPTNDDLTLVIGGWPRSKLAENRKDIEGNVLATLAIVPEFAARFRAATRETRYVGQSLANFMRKPFGAGWALVGDAGYTKDFITALGISDAFRDAELCATALDAALSGAKPFDVAMAEYQSERDRRSLPFYELTVQLAPLDPLPEELEQLLAAAQGDQAAMDQFARVAGAVMSPADFFSEENVARILDRASAPRAERPRAV